jgi:DNA (cytosine-5)-methyltransferase 1
MAEQRNDDAKRLLKVTAGNLRQGHLYVREHLDFFPKDTVGASKKVGRGIPVRIELEGLERTIETDIGRDARTGRARAFLRVRGAIRKFFQRHQIQPGDQVALERLDKRQYRLSPALPTKEHEISLGERQFAAWDEASRELTTVDLFCGAGGITEGFCQAGFTCLYANDFNANAVRTFAANHPQTWAEAKPIEQVEVEYVRKRTGLRRGELGCLVGGPPCQGFSINAPGRFLDDERNALFKHYVKVLDEFQPRTFLMENVPGMLSLGNGAIFQQILKAFQERGYKVEVKILFSALYGVPQERWRLIVLGSSEGAPPLHPKPTHFAEGRANFTGGRTMTLLPLAMEKHRLKQFVTVGDAIGDLPRLRMGEGSEELDYDRPPHSEFAVAMRDGSSTLFNHYAARLAPQNRERMKYVKPGGSWRDIPFELLPSGMKKARRSDHTKRYGRLESKGLAGTVMTKCDPHWGAVFLPDQDRALTVREAARLQSFPDRYRFLGNRVSQYEQVGNAVPVLMARAIGNEIKQYLRTGLAIESTS